MRAQQVDDAARVLPGLVDLRETLVVGFVGPAGFIVVADVLAVAGEQPFVEAVILGHDQAGIGVGAHVFVLDLVLFQQIANHTAEEGDIGAGADRRVDVGHRGGAGEARVHHHQLGVVLDLGFDHPFEAAGMRLGGVAAHDQNHIGILDILPCVGHRPSTE